MQSSSSSCTAMGSLSRLTHCAILLARLQQIAVLPQVAVSPCFQPSNPVVSPLTVQSGMFTCISIMTLTIGMCRSTKLKPCCTAAVCVLWQRCNLQYYSQRSLLSRHDLSVHALASIMPIRCPYLASLAEYLHYGIPGLQHIHPPVGAAGQPAGRKGTKAVGGATVPGLQRCMQLAAHAMRAYQTVANRRPPNIGCISGNTVWSNSCLPLIAYVCCHLIDCRASSTSTPSC